MIIRTLKDITGAEKKEISQFIQKEMQGVESYNVDILYNDTTGKVFVVDTKKSMQYIKEFNTYLNTFRHCEISGNLTIEEIQKEIF